MSFAYPVALDLTGRRCLVVGGGPVAERKVEGLLAAGARVTVVSPSLTPPLSALAREARVAWEPRPYAAGDPAGFALVIAAAGPEVAQAIASDCRERGVWVNCADDPARCDFILPAVFRRGPVTVAVSTGGASPLMASLVRDELDRLLPDDVEALTAVVAAVRRELRDRGVARDPARWRQAVDGEVRRRAAAGLTIAARARLLEHLGVTG